jgi:cytochrome c-type biogenesis protein CcmH/NrfG
MPTSRTSWQRRAFRAGSFLRLGSALLGCSLAAQVYSQPAAATQAPELSNDLSNELGKLRPLLSEETNPNPNYPELIKKVETIIETLKLKGYDFAYICQLKANLYIKSGQNFKAIKPIEDSLIGDYFPKAAINGMTLALAQLYMQEAGTTSDETLRKQRLGQARSRLELWLSNNKEPLLGSPEMGEYIDAVSIYANSLYFLAEFKLSYEVSKKLVRLSIEPNDQAWVMLFAAQQEGGENKAAAETFELFIRKFPERKDFWLQLTQAYLNSDQPLRAILTYQRAQSHGFQTSPSDYLNIFGLYYRLDEFSRAAALMENWINTGKVADTEDNWDLVGACFSNLRREDRVRAVFDTARKHFKTGNLDFQLAQFLWYDGKYKEGLEAATEAWKKGGLKKPGRVALFLATASFEQRDFKAANDFLTKAKASGEVDARDTERVSKMIAQALEIEASRTPLPAAAKKPGV